MTDLATHPDAVAFVRAICSAPEDDTPRLVYADWLEEHGQADRAEFVRLQIRIAGIEAHCWCGACVRKRGRLGQHHNGPCGVDKERDELPDGSSRQAFLRRRERELFPSASSLGLPDGWVVTSGITPDGPTPAATVRRGFVAALTCTAEEWLRVADDVYWHPDQTECSVCGERHSRFPSVCSTCGGVDARRVPRPRGTGGGRAVKCPGCETCREGMIYTGMDGMKWIPHRVPAPAALPHPIETVTLTTNPNANIVGPDLLGHFDRDGGPFVWNDGRWKWVRFVVGWELPTTGRVTPA